MAISTYIIELRVEFADEEKYDHILEMTRQAARDLYTAATLLRDKREPEISLETGDMFERGHRGYSDQRRERFP